MGNTKDIWFLGYFNQDVFITEKDLLEVSHGDHATVRKFPDGYLNARQDVDAWIQGIVTTHSMSGNNLIQWLLDRMNSGVVGRQDHDWADLVIWEKDDEYVYRREFEENVSLRKKFLIGVERIQ